MYTTGSLTPAEKHSLESIITVLDKAAAVLENVEKQQESDGEEMSVSIDLEHILVHLYNTLDFTYYLLYCHFANKGEFENTHNIVSQCGFPYKAKGVKVSESSQDQTEKFKKEKLSFLFGGKLGKGSHFWKDIGNAILEVQPKLRVGSDGKPIGKDDDIIDKYKEESFAILHDLRNQTTHRNLIPCKLEDTWLEINQDTREQRVVRTKENREGLFYQKLKKMYWIELPKSAVRQSVPDCDRLLLDVLNQLVTFVKNTSGKLLSAALLLPQHHGISCESSVNFTVYPVKPFPLVEIPFKEEYLALRDDFNEEMRKTLNLKVNDNWDGGAYKLTVEQNGEKVLELCSKYEYGKDESAAVKEVLDECIHLGILKLK